MDIDFKKLAPRTGSKKEQAEQQSTASLPVQQRPAGGGWARQSHPALHREIDRLFDDAFRGFGFPTLAMHAVGLAGHAEAGAGHPVRPTAVQDRPEVPGIEEKTSRSRSTTTCCWCAVKSVRSRKAKTVVSTGWSAPTAAFSAL